MVETNALMSITGNSARHDTNLKNCCRIDLFTAARRTQLSSATKEDFERGRVLIPNISCYVPMIGAGEDAATVFFTRARHDDIDADIVSFGHLRGE